MTYNVTKYGGVELLTLAPRDEATHTATSSGSWNDSSTWDSGSVPGSAANVLIDEGVTVTLDHQDSTRLETVRVDGTLTFDATSNTQLRVDTLLVSKAGTLHIGTESAPIDPSVTAEVEFLNEVTIQRPDDPLLAGRGLLALGECEIHGAEKTTWDVVDTHMQSGDTTVTLTGTGPASLASHGWQAGDEIVFPDQDPWGGVPAEVAGDSVSPTDTRDDEIRTVQSISGDTITLDSALDVDHVPPESTLDSYVLNLTRNVKLYSESDVDDEYGHIMVMSTAQSIRYCEVTNVGRTDKKVHVSNPLWERGESSEAWLSNPRARYAIHFHRTGPTETPHTVQGCSIRDNPGWGVVNHGSAVDMLDNVSYDIDGCGFVSEKGTESGAFRRNFALKSVGSGEEVDKRKGWDNQHPTHFEGAPGNIDDFAHHGGGFWMHSPVHEVEDNVAAGHRAHGFFWHQRALLEAPLGMENADQTSPDPGELLDGKHDMVPQLPEGVLTTEEQNLFRRGDTDPPVGDPWHTHDSTVYFTDSGLVRQFDNNTAFACGAGASFRSVSFRNEKPRFQWRDLNGYTCYNIGDHYLSDGTTRGFWHNFASDGNVGLDHRYVGNMTHNNYTLIGDGTGVGSSRNFAYTNGWDLESCEIRNWAYGYVPKGYKSPGYNEVRNTTFSNNTTDVLLKSRFPRHESGLVLDGNTYSGTTDLEWEEPWIGDFSPKWSLKDAGVVNYEGRNVYYGWCDPNFVLVEEGDDQRLNDLTSNQGSEWQNALNGDDPETTLPGMTSQQLYDQYDILFHGGLKDPSDADAEQPAEFSGSGGTYDSTPFLGPASKSQPCDEIWVDATNMTLSGDYQVVSYGDGVENEAPLQSANDDTAVQLNAEGRGHEDPPGGQTDQGYADINFDIDRTGTYQVFIRTMVGALNWDYRDQYGHLMYMRMDSGTWQEIGGDTDGAFSSQDGFVWSRTIPKTFDFTSTGTHNFEIVGQGEKMRLDWVLICHETVAAPPLGMGRPHTT